jgi:hypothetical protein
MALWFNWLMGGAALRASAPIAAKIYSVAREEPLSPGAGFDFSAQRPFAIASFLRARASEACDFMFEIPSNP